MNDERDSNSSEASHQNVEEAPASGTGTPSESGLAPAPDKAGTTSQPKTPREIIDATPCSCSDCGRPDGSVFEDLAVGGVYKAEPSPYPKVREYENWLKCYKP